MAEQKRAFVYSEALQIEKPLPGFCGVISSHSMANILLIVGFISSDYSIVLNNFVISLPDNCRGTSCWRWADGKIFYFPDVVESL